MPLHGRALIELQRKLELIEAVLISMCDQLDREDGNQRSAHLIDGAAIRTGAAIRQLQRDLEAADAAQRAEAALARLNGRTAPGGVF